ncbi:hypothetical protein C1X05_00190 [Laceyella sacchari]|nr:hypothetical protein C1X05_00190 [Laceyella sacchari]
MRLHVEGKVEQVKQLQHWSYGDLFNSVSSYGEVQDWNLVKVTCYLSDHKEPKINLISIITVDGEEIKIPTLNLMEVELGTGRQIFACRTFDIFADKKESHQTMAQKVI